MFVISARYNMHHERSTRDIQKKREHACSTHCLTHGRDWREVGRVRHTLTHTHAPSKLTTRGVRLSILFGEFALSTPK